MRPLTFWAWFIPSPFSLSKKVYQLRTADNYFSERMRQHAFFYTIRKYNLWLYTARKANSCADSVFALKYKCLLS